LVDVHEMLRLITVKLIVGRQGRWGCELPEVKKEVDSNAALWPESF
jgi:hypothetical protein